MAIVKKRHEWLGVLVSWVAIQGFCTVPCWGTSNESLSGNSAMPTTPQSPKAQNKSQLKRTNTVRIKKGTSSISSSPLNRSLNSLAGGNLGSQTLKTSTMTLSPIEEPGVQTTTQSINRYPKKKQRPDIRGVFESQKSLNTYQTIGSGESLDKTVSEPVPLGKSKGRSQMNLSSPSINQSQLIQPAELTPEAKKSRQLQKLADEVNGRREQFKADVKAKAIAEGKSEEEAESLASSALESQSNRRARTLAPSILKEKSPDTVLDRKLSPTKNGEPNPEYENVKKNFENEKAFQMKQQIRQKKIQVIQEDIEAAKNEKIEGETPAEAQKRQALRQMELKEKLQDPAAYYKKRKAAEKELADKKAEELKESRIQTLRRRMVPSQDSDLAE